ncbi:hypothetical protein [Staphylococcus chromogenes]|uniref:hypothetical protein n=1 Tax=Staphylococcus chromogenes TaxID=46126 RepID=UPI001C3E852A|nr:hypothetical protein [Staphylococcus chromogenes]MBV5192296.1 hypothetical protein [Staphylococcus chromogenes]MBW3133393.1 hypothetical protein [Staphylococcus chromogenes]
MNEYVKLAYELQKYFKKYNMEVGEIVCMNIIEFLYPKIKNEIKESIKNEIKIEVSEEITTIIKRNYQEKRV